MDFSELKLEEKDVPLLTGPVAAQEDANFLTPSLPCAIDMSKTEFDVEGELKLLDNERHRFSFADPYSSDDSGEAKHIYETFSRSESSSVPEKSNGLCERQNEVDLKEDDKCRLQMKSACDAKKASEVDPDLRNSNGKVNKLQLSLDIFNLTNLLNPNWGKRYNRNRGIYELIEFEGFEGNSKRPTYTFQPFINDEPYYGPIGKGAGR